MAGRISTPAVILATALAGGAAGLVLLVEAVARVESLDLPRSGEFPEVVIGAVVVGVALWMLWTELVGQHRTWARWLPGLAGAALFAATWMVATGGGSTGGSVTVFLVSSLYSPFAWSLALFFVVEPAVAIMGLVLVLLTLVAGIVDLVGRLSRKRPRRPQA